MKAFNYIPDKEEELMTLEQSITQGKQIVLRINKTHFLQRAEVFEKYMPYFIEMENEIVGTGIVSETIISLADCKEKVGFFFDGKVHPEHRREGIGSFIGKTGLEYITTVFHLEKVITTHKAVNIAMARIVARTSPIKFFFPFVYLTIPSNTILKLKDNVTASPLQFIVGLSDKQHLDSKYYVDYKDGLGFFRTHLLYTLTVVKVSPMMKNVLKFLEMINPKKYRHLPKEGQTFSPALIYGLNPKTLKHLPELFKKIQEEKMDYILVCCCKGDAIYKAIQSFSINQTKYFLASNFDLAKSLPLELDARCC